jgi:hypothetical protein
MPKRWEQRTERRPATRTLRRYLIVCEDSKSSLDYFRSFEIPDAFAEMASEGGAGNTISVVERALALRQKAEAEGQPFVQVWCVFDRDEHPKDRYQRAFDLAKNYNDVAVVWANECFELWYLLHFCYRDTGIGRAELRTRLSERDCLNCAYDKADKTIFQLLSSRQKDAIRNAERLAKFNSSPHDNPSTNVHVLVRQLLDLKNAAAAA